MPFLSTLLSVDPLVGRVDKASLPQQTLMELFILKFSENKDAICSDAESPSDVSEWNGVELNDSGEVESINWTFYGLHGLLSLQWLPTTVKTVTILGSFLTWGLDLPLLHPNVNSFNVQGNALEGSVDLTQLPMAIEMLNVSFNKLSGSVDLEKLPDKLRFLLLHQNRFSGNISLRKLPLSMFTLNLSENDLEGETDFSFLPKGLAQLNVSRNAEMSGNIYKHRKKAYYVVNGSKVNVIAPEAVEVD